MPDSSIDRPEREPVQALFITGAPGAGKTALAHEISEVLWRLHEPHAVIDIDELCRGVLPQGTTDFNRDLAAQNLAAVWTNFYALGVRRLVLARILQSDDDLDLIGSAIPEAEILVCRLDVAPSVLATRISQREAGSARTFLTKVSAELAVTIATLELSAFVVDNGPDRTISAVAAEVLAHIEWPRLSG